MDGHMGPGCSVCGADLGDCGHISVEMHASLIGVDLAEIRAERAADLARVRLMKITDPDEINAALKLVGDHGGYIAADPPTSGDYINSEIRAGRFPRPSLAPPRHTPALS